MNTVQDLASAKADRLVQLWITGSNLASLVRSGVLDEQTARSLLIEACIQNGMVADIGCKCVMLLIDGWTK